MVPWFNSLHQKEWHLQNQCPEDNGEAEQPSSFTDRELRPREGEETQRWFVAGVERNFDSDSLRFLPHPMMEVRAGANASKLQIQKAALSLKLKTPWEVTDFFLVMLPLFQPFLEILSERGYSEPASESQAQPTALENLV